MVKCLERFFCYSKTAKSKYIQQIQYLWAFAACLFPISSVAGLQYHFLPTRSKHPVITGSYRLFDGFLLRKKTFCKYQCTGVVYHGCSYKLESVSFGIIHKYAGLAYESPFVLLKVKSSYEKVSSHYFEALTSSAWLVEAITFNKETISVLVFNFTFLQ